MSDESGEREDFRISREELYEELGDASNISPGFALLAALSAVLAAIGLIRGDIAIIIGAMVIAPLLGPNIALSLAATLGHSDLAERSRGAMGAGLGGVVGLSVVFGVAVASR